MAAKDSLHPKQFPPLYHGSDYDFQKGEIVDPKYDQYDDGEGSGAAFATDSHYYASQFGHVHKVEPMDHSDVERFHHDDAIDEETGEPYFHIYMSKKGFKVI